MLGHEAFAAESIRTERKAFRFWRTRHEDVDGVVQERQDLNLVHLSERHPRHNDASYRMDPMLKRSPMPSSFTSEPAVTPPVIIAVPPTRTETTLWRIVSA